MRFTESFHAGTYRGYADVLAHLEKGRGTWAEGTCEPEKLVVAGDNVVALVHVRGRLKNKAEWIEGRFGEVFSFRDGKIFEWRSFAERQQALDWAGLG